MTRSNVVMMPALMHPIWDMYWIAMNMTESLTVKRAVTATQKFFEEHSNKMPTKGRILDMVQMY